MYPNTQKFTWRTYSPLVQRRLDYFFISCPLQSAVTEADIKSAPGTDHSAISLHIDTFPERSRGPFHWRFNTGLINDNVFMSELKLNIIAWKNEYHNKDDSVGLWEFIKFKIRQFSIKFSKQKVAKSKQEIKQLEDEISVLESSLKSTDPQNEHERLIFLRQKLNKFYDNITEGIILRSRVKWYEEGEKSTKYFLNLENRNKTKSSIRKLFINGNNVIGEDKIWKNLKDFYTDKYSRKINVSEIECLNYLNDFKIPSLSNDEAQICEGPLTLNEILLALNSMENNKCLGNDGIPKELYLALFDLVGPFLCGCLNKAYERGKLSPSQRQAVVTLIQKPGKDCRLIKSWRPISLLNVDVKILSKVLSARMTKILPKLIHDDQSAFVSGRFIGEPIRLVSDIMEYVDKENSSGVLFAADFAAAFDSIDYVFMLQTLKKYGFGTSFINWVKLLHTDLVSCVMNNGFSTGYFSLSRGTRQGDPLAPYLFILIIEVLATAVRQNVNIQRIKIGKKEIKQCIYADDTTYFLNNLDSFNFLKSEIDKFSSFTSLYVNWEKSEAAWLGLENTSSRFHPGCKWVNLTTDAIRILGIMFTYNNALSKHLNFVKILEKYKMCLNMWKSKQLTIYGRAEIVRALAFPKLLYVCNMMDPPKDFISKVKSIMVNFVWNGKRP